ncbi:MAG: DUF4347 domain-containing protein, partial [Cyanophyceae cyanobacterium]
MQRSLFVVDSRVIDADQLLAHLGKSAQVLWIVPGDDAVAQISHALAAENVNRLEILSHGQPGQVLLGGDRLDTEKLSQYRNSLSAWGQLLGSAGEIILHGC